MAFIFVCRSDRGRCKNVREESWKIFDDRGARHSNTRYRFAAKVEKLFAKHFHAFLQQLGISKEASCLVVGLGNAEVTPDALGPLAVSNLVVTRHLFQLQPESVQDGFRSVSALAPGVMGMTGIETSDVIAGIVEKFNRILLLPLMR